MNPKTGADKTARIYALPISRYSLHAVSGGCIDKAQSEKREVINQEFVRGKCKFELNDPAAIKHARTLLASLERGEHMLFTINFLGSLNLEKCPGLHADFLSALDSILVDAMNIRAIDLRKGEAYQGTIFSLAPVIFEILARDGSPNASSILFKCGPFAHSNLINEHNRFVQALRARSRDDSFIY